MKYAVLALLTLCLACAVRAWASNMVVLGVSLCSGCTPAATPSPTPTAAPSGVPTPSPTTAPTATPTPGNGSATTADPNANSHARAELAWLIQQEGASSHHISQSSQDVVRNQASTLSNDIVGDGNQWPGAMGVDYCNADWGDVTTAPCIFGSGSDTNIAAKAGWAQHALVFMRTDFPNPAINWTNSSANALGYGAKGTGTCCAGGGCSGGSNPGTAYDCSGGMNAAYVNQMLTSGSTANTRWHQELQLYVSGFQDLQNNGVVIVLGPFQEADSTAFWYGPQLTSSQQANLYIDMEHYFEAQGIHNILYSHCFLAGVSGYPGSQYIDIEAYDLYPAANGGSYTEPQYNSAVGFGKPIIVEEYQAPQSGVFPGILSNYSLSRMANVVGMNQWTSRPNPNTNGGDTSWVSMLNSSYSSLAKNQPAF